MDKYDRAIFFSLRKALKWGILIYGTYHLVRVIVKGLLLLLLFLILSSRQ